MNILTCTRLFVVIVIGCVLAACVSSSPSITPAMPTSLAQMPVATSIAKSTVMEAQTATVPAVLMPIQTLTPILASPTATSTRIPNPEPTRTLVEAAIEFDAKGIVYEHPEGSASQRVQPSTNEGRIGQIAFNGDGAVWFFTDHDVSRIANGHITHFDDERAAIEAAFPWTGTQMLWPVAPDGSLWTVGDSSLLGYNGKTWLSVPLSGTALETIDHIAAGPRGLLAITTPSGLSVYTPEKGWQVPPLPKGISRDLWVGHDLLAGLDGSLWIGLDVFGTGGLLRYIPASQTWTVFDGKDGSLPKIGITGLALNTSGDVWITNDTKGILAIRRAKSGAWEYLTHAAPFPDIYGFRRVYFGVHDDLWLPTIGHCGEQGDPCLLGLAQYANGIWKRYTTADGLAGEHIFAVAVDPSGVPWLVTDMGLQRFQP